MFDFFNRFRWLTMLGVLSLFVVLFYGLGMIIYKYYDQIPTIALGILLSLIIIGLGEILYYLHNGNKETNEKILEEEINEDEKQK